MEINSFPEIGDVIDTHLAISLCKDLNLIDLKQHIIANHHKYKPWIFDGCSMIPDELLGILTKSGKWKDITYKCCLPHDLAYAYGDPDNEKKERKIVDKTFKKNLKKVLGWKWIATLFFLGVRIGGVGWINADFSWGFALKNKKGDKYES